MVELYRRYDVSLELAVRAFSDAHQARAFALLWDSPSDRRALVPQWTGNTGGAADGWWESAPVQRLPAHGAGRVRVPLAGGGQATWSARWLPQRRQALLAGAR